MAVGEWRCRDHPGRPGVGICATCSSTLCEECAARHDGILYCSTCLHTEAGAPPQRRWRSLSAVLPATVLVPLAWLLLGYALYVSVLAAGVLREWWAR